MAVTRDEVVYAYRLILGREPESEEVIQQAMCAFNIAALRQAFLGSREFQEKGLSGVARCFIGRFLGEPQMNIDISCTPDQLQAMFDRIGLAWREFGDTEPHWSVLTNDIFRQDNLSPNLDLFYDSGHQDVAVFLNFLRRANLPLSIGKALDFGCGVGRLTLALAAVAQEVIGVDISQPHLNLATERARERGIDNTGFEAIGSVADMDRYDGFDLVVSRIVLQHNPPPVMAALYAKLLGALAPGGVAIVQMPTYMHERVFSAAEYLTSDQPQMEMNALPQHLVYEIIDHANCQLLEVREDDSAGDIPALSHVFCVRKRYSGAR